MVWARPFVFTLIGLLGTVSIGGCAVSPAPAWDGDSSHESEWRRRLQSVQFEEPRGPTYRVRPGDTLYSVARAYETTIEALVELNPEVEPDHLLVGQSLRVPPKPRLRRIQQK